MRALFSCWHSGTGAEARSRESDIDSRGVYIYRHMCIYVADKGLHCHPFKPTTFKRIDTQGEDVVFTQITLIGYTKVPYMQYHLAPENG